MDKRLSIVCNPLHFFRMYDCTYIIPVPRYANFHELAVNANLTQAQTTCRDKKNRRRRREYMRCALAGQCTTGMRITGLSLSLSLSAGKNLTNSPTGVCN